MRVIISVAISLIISIIFFCGLSYAELDTAREITSFYDEDGSVWVAQGDATTLYTDDFMQHPTNYLNSISFYRDGLESFAGLEIKNAFLSYVEKYFDLSMLRKKPKFLQNLRIDLIYFRKLEKLNCKSLL